MDLAAVARQSLLAEVTLSPKPGLVDPYSNGAHTDMDYDLFVTSINALTPFLHQYVTLGRQATSLTTLFTALRQTGATGERAMLTATRQVNTHKGANFSYAVLLGALGWCLRDQSLAELRVRQFTPVFTTVQEMTAGLTSGDFAQLRAKQRLSYGEQLYVKYGVLGVRGEAEAGYPALQRLALPFLRQHQALAPNYRYAKLMVYLIAQLEDGNVLHRGGQTGLQRVQAYAQQLMGSTWDDEERLRAALVQFDQQLIDWHLSPGGTADLLALSIFFDQLNQSV
ncbi:triphosphoribosyl-dephospho-CoA synthase CitG [Lactiplantibacillus garii]|uniref:Probable 2-(5''-triphosphoribosyl)-3'-dephosphocoenzyme-A synthase n=1 Tax=Lactiplantibacillus garii TaxID=2306423 RepID=A0A426D4S9_9LACO|nr:triphosphoribosyl-dephospho-CoA synthase CitG [Lactiplantibacillus garii]